MFLKQKPTANFILMHEIRSGQKNMSFDKKYVWTILLN